MTIFHDGNGQEWQIDYDGCLWVLRAWAQEKARVTTLSVNSASNGMQEINFDASAFRRERVRLYNEKCTVFGNRLVENGNSAVTLLANCYEETDTLAESARGRFSAVNSHNMQQVQRRVTRGENIVTGLQLTRDVAGIVFMCLIPMAAAAGSVGLGTATALRFGGSVFQGVGTYQDTGNLGAAIASTNFSFVSSLMGLPDGAGRGAQAVFMITNTGNTVARNAALSYLTPGQNSRPFTEVLRQQLVSELGGQLAEGMLTEIGGKLATAVLPVAVDAAGGAGGDGGGPRNVDITDLPILPNGQLVSELPAGLRAAATQEYLERRRARQEQEANERLWRQTPFYRFMLTGERTELMSSGERFVRGHLMRPT